MNIRKIILFLFLLGRIVCTQAQNHTLIKDTDTTTFIPRTLTADEFLNFQLPPIETLFENAKNNPQLGAVQASIEAAKIDAKKSKRDWWSYFNIHAGYNYGILGTYVDNESEYVPLHTTYSGATQSSWSLGANFSLPLDRLINYKMNVKKQKQIIENMEYNKAIILNQLKGDIIELYSNIQYQLKMLASITESIVLYRANYEVAKNDFINNKITANELTLHKNGQQKAEGEYESILNQLQILLLKLELITNTKLIN